MKRSISLSVVTLVLLMSALPTNADIAKPKASPAAQGKIVLRTGLTVVPDAALFQAQARLQIGQEILNKINAEVAGTSTPPSVVQSIAHSSTRTIMAGFFLFLSISFGGVWLIRSGHTRNRKTIAAVLLGVAVMGAASIISQANSGPPPPLRWNDLAQALSAGRATTGGLEIEIIPGGNSIKLIIPLKAPKKPGEEE